MGAAQNAAGSEIFQDLLSLCHRLKAPAGNVVKLLWCPYTPHPFLPPKRGKVTCEERVLLYADALSQQLLPFGEAGWGVCG